MRRMIATVFACLVTVAGVGGVIATAQSDKTAGRVSIAKRQLNNGRQLDPAGRVSPQLGNLSIEGGLTPDGKFLWTLSAGRGRNDVRIVQVGSRARCSRTRGGHKCRVRRNRRLGRVTQVIPMPGVSGGVAFSPDGRTAYVSGTPGSTNAETQVAKDAVGAAGEVIHVFKLNPVTGHAERDGVIAVPPPSGAPGVQGLYDIGKTRKVSWPQDIAVSPDGNTLLVALNLADHAAVINAVTRVVAYVKVGRYPYGAAISRDGKYGFISNEAAGNVSVIDMAKASLVKSFGVGEHLSHPQGMATDPARDRVYVAVDQADQVGVIDTKKLVLEKTLSVARPPARGIQPVALSVTPNGAHLLVANAMENAIAVFDLRDNDSLVGRVPTADYPSGAWASPGERRLIWLSAKGFGTGPNPDGPDPFKEGRRPKGYYDAQYTPHMVYGRAGLLSFPNAARLAAYTNRVNRAIVPTNAQKAPAQTVVRNGGPIKHVFYVVKENRTYDQVFGDDPRGDGDPSLTIFGERNTPNAHALAKRFPLLDHVYANSEASIDGHFWTSAGTVSNYVVKAWHANYGERERPYDFGVYAVTWPSTRFLFDAAEKKHVSYFNYGEALAGTSPLPDTDRNQAENDSVIRKQANSDLGQDGCYPNDASSGGTDEIYKIATGDRVPVEVYDSTLPAGAAPGAQSRFDCFQRRFRLQLATNTVPAFNYLVLPNNHTAGTTPGKRTPQSMVADNDYALGQIVQEISSSSIWKSSVILVIEDDSQNGADHVDAHRIPAAVISPFTAKGAVVHTRYDMVSFIRTLELMTGMDPMNINDALATPLYDAFTPKPDNAEPYNALKPNFSVTEKNKATAVDAALSRKYLRGTDSAPQIVLDRILWHAVRGANSKPPPPGPNNDPEAVGDADR